MGLIISMNGLSLPSPLGTVAISVSEVTDEPSLYRPSLAAGVAAAMSSKSGARPTAGIDEGMLLL